MSIYCKGVAIPTKTLVNRFKASHKKSEYNDELYATMDDSIKMYLGGEEWCAFIPFMEAISDIRFLNISDRVRNDCLSFLLAPSDEMCRRLDEKTILSDGKETGWAGLYSDFIKLMGLEKHSIYVNLSAPKDGAKDRHRKWMRILATRHDEDNKIYPDHYLGIRTLKAAETLCRKYGFKTVKELGDERCMTLKRIAYEELLKMPELTFGAYKEALSYRGVCLDTSVDDNDKIIGYTLSFADDSTKYKASSIDRNLIFQKLRDTYNKLHKK